VSDPRRALPSVNSLLESPGVQPLLAAAPRSVVVEAIRRTIERARESSIVPPGDDAGWAEAVALAVRSGTQASLRRVINGTGVVLHTNLGRAPLAQAAIDAIVRAAAGFTNLEYDIEHGTRGSRYVHCASLLRELTGAGDALVVNNCAAALVLVLNTFANGRDALVSRGELVEIGGSFRIPDIMEKSGARLAEVGTTNRTHLDDYRRALSADTGIVVKVHRSNFAIAGFVAEATPGEIGALAAERGVPFLHDLGSGLLVSLDAYGLGGEPTVADAVRAGGPAGVVTMSGDKLLGGPQAGIILGPRDAIARIKQNPLTRSYRVDKLTLAALETTLGLYREPGRAVREIPALAQLTTGADALRHRADAVCADLAAHAIGADVIDVVESEASVGGGAFPTAKLPSIALAIRANAAELEQRLRHGTIPVVARVAEGRVLIDLRTVFPSEDGELADALRAALR
jgi:L-seryl-tRNA(Ser) seleniumtransferase